MLNLNYYKFTDTNIFGQAVFSFIIFVGEFKKISGKSQAIVLGEIDGRLKNKFNGW